MCHQVPVQTTHCKSDFKHFPIRNYDWWSCKALNIWRFQTWEWFHQGNIDLNKREHTERCTYRTTKEQSHTNICAPKTKTQVYYDKQNALPPSKCYLAISGISLEVH